MTANHTPKLSLMSPVDSDTFSASDFADTFSKIDSTPGITTVANYAALQGLGWGTAQHGRKVIQLDNLAEWIWINPSGSGSFMRTNTLGVLATATQSADVSTTATTGMGVRAVQTGNITIPGGRSIHVNAYLGLDNSSGDNGMVSVTLADNGNGLKFAGYRAGAQYYTDGNHTSMDWFISGLTPGSVHSYSIYIRAESGPVADGGHGTSSARDCILTVIEV